MATEGQYVPDSDDEMGDSSEDETNVVLTPQEWKSKAGDLYKVRFSGVWDCRVTYLLCSSGVLSS